MYQKLFESWRGYKDTLNELEVEPKASEAYGATFRGFLDHLPSNEDIATFEAKIENKNTEEENKFNELKAAGEAAKEAAGERPTGKIQVQQDVVDSPQAAKRYADKVWIFFDTETTGLNVGPYEQITQIAALAVDPKGFAQGVEHEELGRFNQKLNLASRSKEKFAYEREDTPNRERRNVEKIRKRRAGYQEIAPGIFRGKPVGPYELERPGLANLTLTDYGISRDEEKRKKKEYPGYVEKERKAGRTPVSFEEFKPSPGPKEMIKHGPAALKSFLEFIDQYPNRILVAQNAGFDVKQIDYMLQRVGLPVPQDKVFDTVIFFRKYLVPIMKTLNDKKASGEALSDADVAFLKALTKNGKHTVSLGHLVKAFSLENIGWHDAFADVQMLHDCLKACIIFLQSRSEFMDVLSQPQQPERSSRKKRAPGEKPSDVSLQGGLF